MWKKLKSYFITGLLVLTPLVLTVFIIWKLFFAIDGLLRGFINRSILLRIGFDVTDKPFIGVGFISLLLVILITGMIARNYLGKKIIALGDTIVTRIPLVNRVYNAIQQISHAFFSEKREVFERAVLLEYPRRGVYSIGFFTQDTRGEVQTHLKEDVVSVFLPTTPNPTSGFLLFVPKSDITFLEMSVEEALKLVISGGAIVPNLNNKNKEQVIVRDGGVVNLYTDDKSQKPVASDEN